MKLRNVLLLITIFLVEIKAKSKSGPSFSEEYFMRTESSRNSHGFVKFESDGDTLNSNLITFQIPPSNQKGFVFEENDSPPLQKPQKAFSNHIQYQAHQLHFSNHMRDLNNHINQITFQEDNRIEGNKISFDNDIRDSNYGPNYTNNDINEVKDESVSKPVESNVQNEQYNNNINNYQGVNNNKKKKKCRKPKHYNYASPQYPGGYGLFPHGNQGYYNGQIYPQPSSPASIASDAISTVTSALTNIARYDDYQCVSYLLCDAASGGNLPSLGSMQSVQVFTKLQPILHLLAAYNGLTFSPMYVFGRAVFLGATSKDDPGACHQAYPQCPTDPEQLVHYLNNHNGGFFRFFNAPQLSNVQGAHNIEDFYNQLYVPPLDQQNYGFYQPPYYPLQYQYGHPMPGSLGIYSNPNNPQNYSPQYAHIPQNVPQRQNYGLQNNYGFYEYLYNNQNHSPHQYGYNDPGNQGYYGLHYGPQNYSQYQYNRVIPEKLGFQNKYNYGLKRKPKPNRPLSSIPA